MSIAIWQPLLQPPMVWQLEAFLETAEAQKSLIPYIEISLHEPEELKQKLKKNLKKRHEFISDEHEKGLAPHKASPQKALLHKEKRPREFVSRRRFSWS